MSGYDQPTISAPPTPDQYTSSDDAAASSGSNSQLAGTAPACPLQQSPIPCDIDEITLNEIPASRGASYHVIGGHFVAETPPLKRGIRAFDVETSWPKHPVLQVVGDRLGAKSPTKILASVAAFSTCGPSHIKVAMFPPSGGKELNHICPAGVQEVFTFEVARGQSNNDAIAFFERYITWGVSPVTYLVSATSCGNRPGGKANVEGTLTAEVFPADQYQVSISIPPVGKTTYTHEKTLDENAEVTDARTATVQLGSTKATATDTTYTDIGLTISDDDVKKVPQKLKFEFKHNGQSGDDISVNINQLLKILTSAQEAVKAIKDVLKDWVPQAGFKFEFDLSFLAGQIVMAWGYKEHTDWRVYYGLSGKFTLTFFKIDLTLSFGIKVPALLVRVEGTVGGSVGLKTEFNFNSPDTPIAISEKVVVAIPAKVAGRGEAGIGWASVSVEMGVRTGFNGNVGIRSKQVTFELFADIKWDGIDAFIQSHDGPNGADTEDVYHLVDEKSIWEGKVAF